jgi:hypothetical protein
MKLLLFLWRRDPSPIDQLTCGKFFSKQAPHQTGIQLSHRQSRSPPNLAKPAYFSTIGGGPTKK